MITIKNKAAIKKMHHAGQVIAQIFDMLSAIIKPGINTLVVDSFVEQELKKNGLVSQTKGYRGYRHASCVSLNDEVVHGVPDEGKTVKDGDLVKVDICASWQGYCSDAARCYAVGTVDGNTAKLMSVAQQALDAGIAAAKPGNRLTDISASIQAVIEEHGYGIVRDFAGHGIGKSMHEDPEILNYGKGGQGPVLRVGMTLAIEPMLTLGKHDVYVTNDGWTVKTKDKSLAAHVEDTIAIADSGARILTRKQTEESTCE